MMQWSDIAMLTFACVTANHLGLIAAMERVIRHPIPIVNCPKCFTFWMVLLTTYLSGWQMIPALAMSFLCAYIAIWLELIEGFIDIQYNKIYAALYPTTDNKLSPSTTDTGDTDGTLPYLPTGEEDNKKG